MAVMSDRRYGSLEPNLTDFSKEHDLVFKR